LIHFRKKIPKNRLFFHGPKWCNPLRKNRDVSSILVSIDSRDFLALKRASSIIRNYVTRNSTRISASERDLIMLSRAYHRFSIEKSSSDVSDISLKSPLRRVANANYSFTRDAARRISFLPRFISPSSPASTSALCVT